MKVDKRANFCIFFVIAVLALGLSNFAAAFTGDFVSASLPGINDTDKMIALDNDNFVPATINAAYEPKKVVEVNETDNETDSEIKFYENNFVFCRCIKGSLCFKGFMFLILLYSYIVLCSLYHF